MRELLEGPLPVAVHCGLGITYLVLEDGSLQSFGKAVNGQLGLGRNSRSARIPRRVNLPGRLQELRVGTNMTLALNSVGDVFQWGTFLLWDDAEEVRTMQAGTEWDHCTVAPSIHILPVGDFQQFIEAYIELDSI